MHRWMDFQKGPCAGYLVAATAAPLDQEEPTAVAAEEGEAEEEEEEEEEEGGREDGEEEEGAWREGVEPGLGGVWFWLLI